MLDALRDFFDKHLGDGSAAPADTRHSLELAAAALLVEVARIDGAIKPAERTALMRAIHERFALSNAEAQELLHLAEQEMQQAGGYYPFTSLINQNFSQPQKEHLIELMWRAAYADHDLGADEQHVIRKIAGLLHVADNEYILAKLRAKQASGAP